jgi:hypothetical protein
VPLHPAPRRACPECGADPDHRCNTTSPWAGIVLLLILCATAIIVTYLITTR